jgi:ElaA protein
MSIRHWEVKRFQELTVDQLYELLQLRVEVFVVEQQCAYPELDAYDRQTETRHLTGCDERGQLLAYARILPPGLKFAEANLGRFVVKREARGKGIGHELLPTALDVIQKEWPGNAVKIQAQEYLQQFYARYGFTRISNVYIEDGIPHVEMRREALDISAR